MRNLLVAGCVESFTLDGMFQSRGDMLIAPDFLPSDTLLRHTKTHKARDCDEEQASSNTWSGRGTMINGVAPGLNSDFDINEVTLELMAAGGDRSSTLVPGSPTLARPDFDAFSHDETAAEHRSLIEHPPSADAPLQFDPSNWLLDEDLVDFGLGDAWNELRYTDNSTSWPRSTLATERANQLPAVSDLRQVWYNQPRRTLHSLHHDDEHENREPSATTLRSDIDETYRTHMVEELCISPRRGPLPSLDFMVTPSSPAQTSRIF
jgi:hypothetical protein